MPSITLRKGGGWHTNDIGGDHSMTARRTSEVLLRMVGEHRGPERLTVGDAVTRLGERSFGML